ncbi:hypothetical protein [Galenea microaerophila]
MIFIRLWILVLVASAVSWLVLRVMNKPRPFLYILLFWMLLIFGSMGIVYGVSIWYTSGQT